MDHHILPPSSPAREFLLLQDRAVCRVDCKRAGKKIKNRTDSVFKKSVFFHEDLLTTSFCIRGRVQNLPSSTKMGPYVSDVVRLYEDDLVSCSSCRFVTSPVEHHRPDSGTQQAVVLSPVDRAQQGAVDRRHPTSNLDKSDRVLPVVFIVALCATRLRASRQTRCGCHLGC